MTIAIVIAQTQGLSLETSVAHANAIQDQFTISMWAKPSGAVTTASRALLVKNNALRLVTNASSQPACQIHNGSDWQTSVSSSVTIIADQWNFVTCTYDKAALKIYVNGIQTGTQALTVAVNDSATDFKYGTDDGAVYSDFIGAIDDLRIYDYARSQKQIISDMNAGHPSVGSPVGSPVAYWKFDEGFGTAAKNSGFETGFGGSALNGTISGATWSNEGKYGKALSFDGTASVTATIPSVEYENAISLWIKPATSIASKTLVTSGKLTTNASGQPVYGNCTGTAISLGAWTHILAVSNGSGYCAIFQNGVQTITSTTGVSFGTSVNIGGSSYTGLIDEVKIYNYALTPEEVLVEYNQGKALQLGALGTDPSDGVTPSNASLAGYCVPGDTSTCRAPVGEWLFDEGTGGYAEDSSGNGNRGTVTGASWVAGKVGKGLSFDGTANYVDVGEGPSTVNTISLWAKPNSTTEYIIDLDGSNYIWANSGTVTATGFSSPTIYVNGIRTTTLSAGIWQNITITTGTAENGSDLDIGRLEGTGYFNGSIDQVRIYDYARTPAQIAWEYNKGAPVAHYRLDECTGTTAYDASGNQNHGTISIGSSGFDYPDLLNTSAGNCTTANSAWYNGINFSTKKQNSTIYLDGEDDYVNIGDIDYDQIHSIAFWISPYDSDQQVLQLSASDSVAIANRQVVVTGFGDESVYVNGKAQTGLDKGIWNHVTVVTGTEVVADAVSLGKVGSGYFRGRIDDIRIFNYELTGVQIGVIMNEGAVRFGAAGEVKGDCPAGFVLVPGDPLYGTDDFCVMKYEAKCDTDGDGVGNTPAIGNVCNGSSVADGTGNYYGTYRNSGSGCACTSANGNAVVSSAAGSPIAYIGQTVTGELNDANEYCAAHGWTLISEAQWMTLARNIEAQSANWCTQVGSYGTYPCGNTPGTGMLASGHSDNVNESVYDTSQALPASTDDAHGCYLTATGVTACNGTSGEQKRTHTLSNGEVVWDLSGNVWHWTSGTIDGANKPDSGVTNNWVEWTYFNTAGNYGTLSYDQLRPSNTTWNSTQRIGQYYMGARTGGTTYGFLRGGYWNSTTNAGVFNLNTIYTPTSTSYCIGFRCVASY